MDRRKVLVVAQETLGHQFADEGLLLTALTHASIADTRLASNERLEFLGDAILGMVVCEELYRRFSDWQEGELTKVKSVVVSRRTCASISDETGLSQMLILGNGIGVNSELPLSVRAAVFEAMIGALFLDSGLDVTRRFILAATKSYIDECSMSQTHDNFKSALQQYVQRHMATTPKYETMDEQGPDHSKCFEIAVVVSGRRYPSAWGPSKKEAEQAAARLALDMLTDNPSTGAPE